MPSNASLFNGLGGPSMPIGTRRSAATAACGGGFARDSISPPPETSRSFTASIIRSFNALKPFVFSPAENSRGPTTPSLTTFAGDQKSRDRKALHGGRHVKILGQPFRVSGIVQQGKGGRKLIPLETMGELMGADGKASLFYIKCDNPANDDAGHG